MIQKASILLVALIAIAGISVSVASAEGMPALDLPPGIAAQAQPLLEGMMVRMQDSNMTMEQRQMMMEDMQTMAEQLPPGIFLKILKLMPQLDMADMMFLHQQVHQGDLLQQPPGQLLSLVRELATN